ncbi:MAG TPA: hypothetical protein VFS67_31130 [Polyangiaceae bacterium]|nr:hypothetical protein [Polyangiaceae bacterium]
MSEIEAPDLDQLGATPGAALNTFRADCIGRSIALGDPVTGYGRSELWKVGGAYEEHRPDGVLILAGAGPVESLESLGAELLYRAGLQSIFAEEGSWNRDSREDFGFLDGQSKPGVGARPASGEPHPGVIPSGATSVHPVDTLLLAPEDGPSWATGGSFLVYRRLVQDVEAFRAAMDRYAASRTRRGKVQPERAAERVIGRRKDGSALALSARELATTGDKEAFDYSNGACPVAAHTSASAIHASLADSCGKFTIWNAFR